MTKAELIGKLYLDSGYTKNQSAEIIETVFNLLKEKLENGEQVKISGFGKFEVMKKNARRGRNPQTGEPMEISARNTLVFRPSKVLRDTVTEGKS